MSLSSSSAATPWITSSTLKSLYRFNRAMPLKVRDAGAIQCFRWSKPSWRLFERIWPSPVSRVKTIGFAAKFSHFGAVRAKLCPGSKPCKWNALLLSNKTENSKSTQRWWLSRKCGLTIKIKHEKSFKPGKSNIALGKKRRIKRTSKRLSSQRSNQSLPSM